MNPTSLPAPSRPARATLYGLQGLRGFAAVLVVCDHALATLSHKAGSATDLSFAWFLGGLGVQIFFAISGLTMILAHGNDFGTSGASSKFAARRLGRIVPLYWITTFVYFFKQAAAHAARDFRSLLLSLCFVPHAAAGQSFGTPVYGLGWTLEYEMFFYLAFAVALFASRRAALIALTVFFGGLSGRSIGRYFAPDTVFGFLGSPIVLFFVAGIGIGVVRNKIGGLLPWGFGTSVVISLLAVVAAVLAAAIFGATNSLATGMSVVAALTSVLVCGLARLEAEQGRARHFAKVLGDSTYAIYLTHCFILGPEEVLAGRFVHGLPSAVFIAVMVPICAGFGWLVFKYVDGPASKWFGAWLSAKLKALQGVAKPNLISAGSRSI